MVATTEVAVGAPSLATAVLAPGAKMPPGLLAAGLVAFGAVGELVAAPRPVYWPLLAAEEVAAAGFEAAGALAAGVVYEPVPDPALEAGEALPDPEPAGQVPPGACLGKFNGDSTVTWFPGFGKSILVLSVVVHLLMLARLATNIPGRESIEPEPPEIETLAQFMYISRLPTLLNHVQAMTAAPLLTSAGILKDRALIHSGPLEPVHMMAVGRLPGAPVGHPPTKLWMTFQLAGSLSLAASVSYVKDI